MAYLKKSRNNYYGIYKGQGNKTRCISLKTQSLSLAKQRLRAVNKLEYEIKLGITEDPLAAVNGLIKLYQFRSFKSVPV
jgi:hypothetical protein